VLAERWWADGTGRRALLTAAVAVQAPLSVMFALPMWPAGVVGWAPVLAVNETLGEQIGLPQLIAQVAAVYHVLPQGAADPGGHPGSRLRRGRRHRPVRPGTRVAARLQRTQLLP